MSIDGGDIIFNARELAREYGREIEGVTTTTPARQPELVPVTPEERLLVHNLRETGASVLQISAALQNHRLGGDENALRDALFREGATLSQIEAILRAIRRTRRVRTAPPGPLLPNTLEEIFSGLGDAGTNQIVRPLSENWALLPDEIVGSDAATRAVARRVEAEIRALDTSYEPARLAALGHLTSVQARSEHINRLRFDHAVAVAGNRRDYRPLQVETLRAIQIETDAAYERGIELLRQGRLTVHLSEGEALGNYVDGQVRDRMRMLFEEYGIDWSLSEEVRIQRREYDTSRSDLTYRVPDVAIKEIMFDATITSKGPGRAQIRGYFGADSRPDGVVIVRPTRLGGSYFITPPDDRRLKG